MTKRTNIDFTKMDFNVTKNDDVAIYELRDGKSYYHRVTVINAGGVCSITGDFGNWIFCREFHPSVDGYVSGGYMDEKLETYSVQESKKFDTDETKKRIDEYEKNLEEYYKEEKFYEEEKDWIEELRYNVDDEIEYMNVAFRQKPHSVEYESVPFGKERHFWLNCVYDAFDEMCNRITQQNKTNEQ